jgi:hypothetical protein
MLSSLVQGELILGGALGGVKGSGQNRLCYENFSISLPLIAQARPGRRTPPLRVPWLPQRRPHQVQCVHERRVLQQGVPKAALGTSRLQGDEPGEQDMKMSRGVVVSSLLGTLHAAYLPWLVCAACSQPVLQRGERLERPRPRVQHVGGGPPSCQAPAHSLSLLSASWSGTRSGRSRDRERDRERGQHGERPGPRLLLRAIEAGDARFVARLLGEGRDVNEAD